MSILSRSVDRVLEATIVGSFTRLGYAARKALGTWEELTPGCMRGRVVVLTGATSGLGRASARELLRLGAHVTMLVRNAAKAEQTCTELRAEVPECHVDFLLADMGQLGDVQRAAMALLAKHDHIDVLIHNAGSLDDTYRATREGIEQTVATHVIGPYVLTSMLLPALTGHAARVLFVASGGMYSEPLDPAPEMPEDVYDGVKAYAKAKRAQVTLSELLGAELQRADIRVHSMHPGWADTPGVERSLPTFRKLTRPLLRSVAQGADTLVWLAASDQGPRVSTGKFWLDREVRSIHKLPSTRKSDTLEARAALWAWVEDRASVNVPSMRPPPVAPTTAIG